MALTNVLPGFRQLRAPLAAGYLWLLFVYLVADLNEVDASSGLTEEIADLGAVLSPVGIAVAVSFAAYILGSLSTWIAGQIGRGIYSLVIGEAFPRAGLTARGFATLEDLIAPRAASGQLGTVEEAGRVAREVVAELDLVKTRLVGTEPELHAEIDRMHAEADFRFALFVPLGALGIVAGLAIPIGDSEWRDVLRALTPIAAFAMVYVLMIQAVVIWAQANDKLVDAVYLERVDSPALERLDRESPAA